MLKDGHSARMSIDVSFMSALCFFALYWRRLIDWDALTHDREQVFARFVLFLLDSVRRLVKRSFHN